MRKLILRSPALLDPLAGEKPMLYWLRSLLLDLIEDLPQRPLARHLEDVAAGFPRHLFERPGTAAHEAHPAIVESAVVVPHAVHHDIGICEPLRPPPHD